MSLDEVYEQLIPIVSDAGAQVDVPIESERFFSDMAERHTGTAEEFLSYVKENVGGWFKAIGEGPDWLQEAEWQFSDGRPMIFVGQLDIPANAGYFHDDARVFVFWSQTGGETESVMQVA